MTVIYYNVEIVNDFFFFCEDKVQIAYLLFDEKGFCKLS